MDKEDYKFRVKLGNFELEVVGDKGFVEKTINRYEGRFLPRFHQLIDAAGEQHHAPEKSGETSGLPSDDSQGQKGSGSKKEKRYRRSRSKKRRNSSATTVRPAPELPKNQQVTKETYWPENEKAAREDELEFEEIKVTPLTSTSPEKADDESSANSGKDASFHINSSDLKGLYDRISPRTHHEKTLVFAYYLQNRNNHEDFSSNEIRRCYREIGADPAGNISQVLNHASRSGFLSKISRGRQLRFSLTSKGRHFVERGLELEE